MRRRALIALVPVTLLGLGTSYYEGPAAHWVRDHLSGVLYVVSWILVVHFVFPRAAPWKVALGVLAFTCAVEFLQLWQPAWLEEIRRTWLGRSLLGSTFKWSDLPYYGVGAALGFFAAILLARVIHEARGETEEKR